MEEQGTWAPRTQKHSEAGYGRPVDGGVGTAKTVKRPLQQPQYANYWAPLTRKRHGLPHPAQPQHTNHWAPRTRKRHQQEHRLQRPTERSDPTHCAKGRTDDCPGPCKETTTRRNVTRGVRGQRFFLLLEHCGVLYTSIVQRVIMFSVAFPLSSSLFRTPRNVRNSSRVCTLGIAHGCGSTHCTPIRRTVTLLLTSAGGDAGLDHVLQD